MKNFLPMLSAVLMVLSPALSSADCRQVVRKQVVTVVEPAIIATFAPLALFSVGYVQPPALQPQPAVQAKGEDKLLEYLQKIDRRLDALEKGIPQQALQQPQAKSDSHLVIFQAKCAKCHDAAVSDAKGGGITLTNGMANVGLPEAIIMKVLSSTYTGRMPKSGQPLKDDEVAALQQWVDELRLPPGVKKAVLPESK